jgi:polyketide biosynthesis acyl carrier protein
MTTITDVFEVIADHARDVVPSLAGHAFRAEEALKDLGANSVDRSEIVMMTLESLSINVSLVELAEATNLGELASLLHGRL